MVGYKVDAVGLSDLCLLSIFLEAAFIYEDIQRELPKIVSVLMLEINSGIDTGSSESDGTFFTLAV